MMIWVCLDNQLTISEILSFLLPLTIPIHFFFIDVCASSDHEATSSRFNNNNYYYNDVKVIWPNNDFQVLLNEQACPCILLDKIILLSLHEYIGETTYIIMWAMRIFKLILLCRGYGCKVHWKMMTPSIWTVVNKLISTSIYC